MFAIFKNLCLLGNGEHPQYLQLEYLHMVVAVELIQSILTNQHKSSARRMPVSPSAYVHTSCPHITVISRHAELESCSYYCTTPSPHSSFSALLLRSRFAVHVTGIIFLVLEQSWLNWRQTQKSFSRCSSNLSAARRGWSRQGG